MQKFILFLFMLFCLPIFNVFSYSSSEGSLIIEDIKNTLKNTNYSFVDNESSSSKASYHIFFDGKMVGYIYASENGISMGDGWEGNGEVGTLWSEKNLSKNDILKYFYKYNTANASVSKDSFKISKEKISYNKDTKNLRMYYKISLNKRGNFMAELSFMIKFGNGGRMGVSKKEYFKEKEKEVYYGTILNGDDGKSIIDSYDIKIYECTSGIVGNICGGKRQITNFSKNNLNISTGFNYNIIEPEVESYRPTPKVENIWKDRVGIKTSDIVINSECTFGIKDGECLGEKIIGYSVDKKTYSLYFTKQLIISKSVLNKSSKTKDYIEKINKIIETLDETKLRSLEKKIQTIKNGKKQNSILDYFEAKLSLKLKDYIY